jgi:hypothetical protein
MAKDRYHEEVKNALRKDGWTITDDPLLVDLNGEELKIDLGLEKVLGARKNSHLIAVEIKCFHNISAIVELQRAIGQLSFYQEALLDENIGRELYLAIPITIYKNLINRMFFSRMLKKHNIPLIIYDPENEEILEWIKF